MRARLVEIYIPGDLYRRVQQSADGQERDVHQQLRWLIKQALTTEPAAAREPEHHPAAEPGLTPAA